MWARSLRSTDLSLLYRVARLKGRRRNGSISGNSTGSHTTYFQPPPPQPKPPRRIFRGIVLGSICVGIGAYAQSWLTEIAVLEGRYGESLEDVAQRLNHAMQVVHAVNAPPLDVQRAQMLLETASGYSITRKAVSHTCSLPSNLPCEDTWTSGTYRFFDDPAKDWSEWAIFDGHAGPRTSHVLKETLLEILGDDLSEAGCPERPYKPNDQHIIDVIRETFVRVDDNMLRMAREHINGEREGKGRADVIAASAPAYAGSCALVALFDPRKLVLRVANTGDSRAVLGRWDKEEGKYVAQLMSTDQTGFNQDEVARMKRDHPGEDPIDPETGRTHGLAVTRAFGDARWKWPEELTRRAHELFFGPSPRPNGVIKTPPYLTAEPEVTETKIRDGAHADFLIMASDGLWDLMSSDDAVACVQLWLEKNKPTDFLEKEEDTTSLINDMRNPQHTHSSIADLSGDDDSYYDAEERCLKWKVSPEHFINEDDHCGTHLVKNALGGRRRDLFTGLMSVQPPLSRNVRDDITVHIIFFGVDVQETMDN